jgi:hypothetical protein
MNLKGGYGISILIKLNRFHRALVYAGPAFDTILRADRIGFIFFDLVDFAGTDFKTVSATNTFFVIHYWVHLQLVTIRTMPALIPKLPITIPKSQANSKFQF